MFEPLRNLFHILTKIITVNKTMQELNIISYSNSIMKLIIIQC